jgi:hypothetical protein
LQQQALIAKTMQINGDISNKININITIILESPSVTMKIINMANYGSFDWYFPKDMIAKRKLVNPINSAMLSRWLMQ